MATQAWAMPPASYRRVIAGRVIGRGGGWFGSVVAGVGRSVERLDGALDVVWQGGGVVGVAPGLAFRVVDEPVGGAAGSGLG